LLLSDKNAVIYGGGESIGGGVARAFAREGARVFLAGRSAEPLERVAASIRSAGGMVETAVVDAIEEREVDEHADAIAAAAGGIDISFNLTSHGYVQGTPLAEMALGDYLGPLAHAVRTTFLTARAAARQMVPRGSGVILMFGGAANPPRGVHLGSLQVTLHAIEAMRRQLSSELGPRGIRVVSLLTSGVPEAIPAGMPGRERIVGGIERVSLLGRAATLEDVGNVAAFAASDSARTITGASINISCGTFFD
jgi:NAD(P)-dependent dehydrogenase (short-subunit alcohol dehydrogenase family)